MGRRTRVRHDDLEKRARGRESVAKTIAAMRHIVNELRDMRGAAPPDSPALLDRTAALMRAAPVYSTHTVAQLALRDMGEVADPRRIYSLAEFDEVFDRWATCWGYSGKLRALVDPQILCAISHEAPYLNGSTGLAIQTEGLTREGGELAPWELLALAVRLARRAAVLDLHTGRVRAPAPMRTCCVDHSGLYFSTDANAMHPCTGCGYALMPVRMLSGSTVASCSNQCRDIVSPLLRDVHPSATSVAFDRADIAPDCSMDMHTAPVALDYCGRVLDEETGELPLCFASSRVGVMRECGGYGSTLREVGAAVGLLSAAQTKDMLTGSGQRLLLEAWAAPLRAAKNDPPKSVSRDAGASAHHRALSHALQCVCSDGIVDLIPAGSCPTCSEDVNTLRTRARSPAYLATLASPRHLGLPHVVRLAAVSSVDVNSVLSMAHTLPRASRHSSELAALMRRNRVQGVSLLADVFRCDMRAFDRVQPAVEFAQCVISTPGPWTTDTGVLLRDTCCSWRVSDLYRQIRSTGTATAARRAPGSASFAELPDDCGRPADGSRRRRRPVAFRRADIFVDLLRVDRWYSRCVRDCAYVLALQLCAVKCRPRTAHKPVCTTACEDDSAARLDRRVPTGGALLEDVGQVFLFLLHLLDQKVFLTNVLSTLARVLANEHCMRREQGISLAELGCAGDAGLSRRLRRNVGLSLEYDDLLVRALGPGSAVNGPDLLSIHISGILPSEFPWARQVGPALRAFRDRRDDGSSVAARLQRMPRAQRVRVIWSRAWLEEPEDDPDARALERFHAQRGRRVKLRRQIQNALDLAERWLSSDSGTEEARAREQRWRHALGALISKDLGEEALLSFLEQRGDSADRFPACKEAAEAAPLLLTLSREAHVCSYIWKRSAPFGTAR